MERCDPWPLNPKGELLLGVKLESPEGVANCEAILRGAGAGICRDRPGRSEPFARLPHDCRASPIRRKCRRRATASSRPAASNGVAFLQGCTPDNIVARIDEGVRVIAGHSEAAAIKGRAHQKRTLPV